MAKAITQVHKKQMTDEEKRKKDLLEIENALLDNKQAIMESLQIINHMQERGILSLLSGLFGQGDKVLDVLVKAVDKPENTNTIKNLLLLVGVLGKLDVKHLEPILLKVNAGIERVYEHGEEDNQKTGYFDMVKALKDPEVNRSVTLILNFLKGMGADTEPFERNTQHPVDHIRNREESGD
ncbi:DUF1641 domain-containing protein [Falsibacillus albus]|uniref:DUF1641 domain-containing protein n=1 Tax=Falsibacillus albus TaxID=2478915 RepID=A0A3L7K1H8_9BACI|nr:DUF1641 domain-containing protein [Falsibacillus albus]RLQ96650.1 DUF1641 domain-containing protein [Falsibacillus albus]